MRVVAILLIILLLLAGGWYAYQQGGSGLGRNENAPPARPAAPTAAEEESVGTPAPRFDIVRVSRSGFAVVAGTGAPGAKVELIANEELVAEQGIGADGAWAISTDTPLAAGPVELVLRQTTEDGTTITGEETIVIYVSENETDSPVVLRTTPGGATEVLQRASDPATGLGPLAIETIDYDAAGNVIFAGRATPGSTVQLLLGGVPIAPPMTVDEEGRWELPAEVAPGLYTLRIVQLGPDGRAAYVVEVPFERAQPEDVRRVEGGVVVQPGNSLWVISRSVYGEGRQYTVIYEANAEQIRDPDLIYPGQVFRVPEE